MIKDRAERKAMFSPLSSPNSSFHDTYMAVSVLILSIILINKYINLYFRFSLLGRGDGIAR